MLTDWREQGFGVGPISHREIRAWAGLYRVRPSPAEVDGLRALCRAFRHYHIEKNTPDSEKPASLSEGLIALAEAREREKRGEAKKKREAAKKAAEKLFKGKKQ